MEEPRTPAGGRVVAAVAALTTLLLLSSAALGDTTSFRDGNDTPGRLDLESVVQGHRASPQGRLLRHRVTTFGAWRTRLLARDDENWINLFFDLDDDKRPERRLHIDVKDGKLTAKMQKFRSLTFIGRAQVWRPNRRSVSVAFPRDWLEAGVSRYEWSVFSLFSRGDRPGACGVQTDVVVLCSDRAPDKKRFVHRL